MQLLLNESITINYDESEVEKVNFIKEVFDKKYKGDRIRSGPKVKVLGAVDRDRMNEAVYALRDAGVNVSPYRVQNYIKDHSGVIYGRFIISRFLRLLEPVA